MQAINVTKRSGNVEPLSLNKIHRVLEWACEDITGVSISEIELRANIQLYDGIAADHIHDLLIKSSSELISENTPNYQWVAARLINYKLRKEVYQQYEPIHILEHVKNNIDRDLYEENLLTDYSEEEWDKVESYIRHNRDYEIAYAGMEQLRGKYLVQDRSTGEIYETPQMLYMLVAMTLFSAYPKDTRMRWVKKYYDAISTFKISLPTPIMAGARTKKRQYSSCVLIEADDDLQSIFATGSAVGTYAANRAGIGINGGRIRAVGSKIRSGEIVSTGIVPYWRFFRGALKSCSQGGIRGASATINYPFWHLEAEDLIVLKNAKGTFETRIRDLDYCIHLNKLFLERVLTEGHITLFSPDEVPDLYDAFYSQDTKLFEELYTKYERSRSVRKRKLSAKDFFETILLERQTTGRIYILFADNVNKQSSFDVPVKMTNLCVAGDTMIDIRLDNNITTIPIDDLRKYYSEDLMVRAWNHKSGCVVWTHIVDFAKTADTEHLIEITHDNGATIRVTAQHKIWTENRGYVEAQDLKEDDVILCKEGDFSGNYIREYVPLKIKKIELPHPVPVYDITTKTGNFFGNNILVHNCTEITLPTEPFKNSFETYSKPNGKEKKILKMTKEEYEKYLVWKKNNKNTTIKR